MKINRLDDLQVFVAAAEAGSFTDVARHLHLTPAAVSAVVKRLEQALGTRLFERSTRHVRLSEAGERLLAPARQALQALAQCEGALQDANDPAGRLAGPLRMALPSDLGRHQLLGWLAEFLADDEAVSLELRVSDRLSHLLEQPVDLAVRYGEPDDSGFIALPLAPRNARVLVASPAYLARHGAPQTPAELRRHNCLRFVLGESLYSRWRLEGVAAAQTVEVRGRHQADDGAVVRQWAVQGLGIAYKSALDVADDLAAGRLLRLLPGWSEPAPLNLVVVSRQQLTPGLRRLAAFLAQRCQALLAPLPECQQAPTGEG